MDLTAWMAQWNMLPPGGLVLCAVSGGRDSVCLLHYLWTLRRRGNFSLAAAHYNHHMRPTAGRDESFVAELCRQLDVPLYVEGTDVCAAAREWGCGVEEAGRRLRYDFLQRTADRIGADRIATAHHMGDQAETVLLHLLRGTGPEGLAGIPPVRGRLIRPLLQTSRQEIESYLQENGLSHVEDETNENLDFARNRLRRVVLPELEKISPALRENIARTARIVDGENRYLNSLAMDWLPPEGTQIPCRQLLAAPEALRPRLVRLLLDRLAVGKKDFSAAHVEAVLVLAARGGRGMISLPGGAAAITEDGTLRFQLLPQPLPQPVVLRPGRTDWGPYTFWVEQKKCPVRQEPHAIYLSCDTMDRELRIGGCTGRERLTLPGSRGARSVKRLLTEHGVAPERRSRIPCVAVDGVPAAVWGLGTDIRFLPASGEAVEIRWIEKEKAETGGTT